MQTVKVLCARCHVPLEGPAEPNPEDRMSCPRCGEGDRCEAVIGEVNEYIQVMASQKIAKMFNQPSALADGRTWRFIAHVEL